MSDPRRQSLYADPAVYDILYTPGTAAEIDALERIERRLADGDALADDRLWLEPACGTGRYLRTAARRGRRVAGYDRDPAMLAYARRGLPDTAQLFEAAMQNCGAAARNAGLEPGSVAFAFNPVNTLRHLTSDAQVLDHLAQTAALLRRGAVYVVGISLTDYGWLLEEEDVWVGTRGRCKITQLVNYLPPVPGTPRARRERVISHLVVERPRGAEHIDDVYDLRCYDETRWRRLISRSALTRVGSFDAHGRPLAPGTWPYQLEALRKP